jgi:hypothetical protein
MNILKRKDYRLVVVSDMHCGHAVGLTHPDYQGKIVSDDVGKRNKLNNIQKAIWDFYATEITNLQRDKKIDILVSNGDAIDGDGWRSGGTELITTDRNMQVQIAKSAIKRANANTNIIVAGTPYHTGNVEDFEEILAQQINGKFENHAWLDINGVIFDIKHNVGSSSVPQSRQAPIAKEMIWAKLWQEKELIPKPVSYLIRSHIHYFNLLDDGDMTAITTPALQGFGSKFGSKMCSGIPTIGFVSFDILANKTVIMRKHFLNLTTQKAKATLFN